MKQLLLSLLFFVSSNIFAQGSELEDWINAVSSDMVEMNDLGKYSSSRIPEEVTVNFIMVDRYKIKSVDEDSFVLEIDHGKGVFCSEVHFQYSTLEGRYFIVFDEIRESEFLGRVRNFVDPWKEKITLCK